MDTIDLIRNRLSTLSPLVCELQDDSHRHAGHAGAQQGGGHFKLRIVSTQFAQRSTLVRHRMIYSALGELMHTRIHALSIQAHSPDETGTT